MAYMASYLTGITPQQVDGTNPPTGSAANGVTKNITGTSLAATALPTAAIGASQPQPDGTNVTPSRYPRKMRLSATPDGGVCIRFGISTMSAATSSDAYIPPGGSVIYTRPRGVTHYRAISEDGTSATRLKLEVEEWETDFTN